MNEENKNTSEKKSRKEIYQERYQESKRGGGSFFPEVMFHDTVVAIFIVAAIFILAILIPTVSAGPANPVGTAFSPKPEWYFVWVQTWLRLFPGSIEPIGAIVLPLIVIIILIALPFFNRGLDRSFARRKGIMGVGAFLVTFMIVLEVYGFLYPPSISVPAAPPPPPGATYTQVAKLGETAYNNSCAACHGENGEGVVAPAVWGSTADLGEYKTAQGLFDYISKSMPEGSAGSLTKSTNLDILGYMLLKNNFVSGSTVFNENDLGNIDITSGTETPTPTAAPTSTPVSTPTSTPATTSGATFGSLAEAGEGVYASSCASCHGAQGEGGDFYPALWGSFANLKSYNTAQGLLSYISKDMPPGGGGSLSAQDYQDLLSYLLIKNNDVSSSTQFNSSQLGNIPLK